MCLFLLATSNLVFLSNNFQLHLQSRLTWKVSENILESFSSFEAICNNHRYYYNKLNLMEYWAYFGIDPDVVGVEHKNIIVY